MNCRTNDEEVVIEESINRHHERIVWKNLVEWVQACGGQVHSALELQGEGPSRGVYTTGEIQVGELLIQIPSRCVVSGETVDANGIVGKQSLLSSATIYSKPPSPSPTPTPTPTLASPWLKCVAAYYQAGIQPSDQFFDPYVQSLPNQYETLLQWTDSQIHEYLGGTTLGWMVQSDRQDQTLQNRYRTAVKPYLQSLQLIPSTREEDDEWHHFVQACNCISTRGFHLMDATTGSSSSTTTTINGNSTSTEKLHPSYPGPFLLPVIDLLNHDPPNSCTTLQRSSQDGSFVMMAERTIGAKQEVVHSYGNSLTSAQLLQTFGFVPRRNIERALSLPHWLVRSKTTELPSLLDVTPLILSKTDHLIPACQAVASSTYPSQLQATIHSQQLEDEVWDVSQLPYRNLPQLDSWNDHITISLVQPLTEELITLICLCFLPDEMIMEVSKDGTLLDGTILEDYYLGHLVCQSLLVAIENRKKGTAIRPIGRMTNHDIDGGSGTGTKKQKLLLVSSDLDRECEKLQLLCGSASLQTSSSSSSSSVESERAKYGLTIRIEELMGLEMLQRKVLEVVECLQRGLSVEALLKHK